MYTGPSIATDGMVLSLDAANTKSYVSGSTTWNDMLSSTTGSLTNGPTFNSSYGGNISFDRTNDYVNLGPTSNTTSSIFTYCFWAAPSGSNRVGGAGLSLLGNSRQAGPPQVYLAGGFFYLVHQDIIEMGSCSLASSGADGTWNYYCVSYISPTMSFYINGNLINTASRAVTFTFSSNNRWIGARGNIGNPIQVYGGQISIVNFYNRVLSASEVFQNYNAQKSRFGL